MTKTTIAEIRFADDTAMANVHYILQDRNVEENLIEGRKDGKKASKSKP